MSLSESLRAEFAHECTSTRKMLARAPADRFDWKPHDKSMTLVRLIGHIAEIPDWIGTIAEQDELDFATGDYQPFAPGSVDELLARFDGGVAAFAKILDGVSDETLMQPWTMRNGDQVLATMPRIAAIRAWIISHSIHHRGQLSVYLRLLDVALPHVYGPTADDESF